MAMAYPEAVCLRSQMAEALIGKEVAGTDVLDVTKTPGAWRFGSIDQPPGMFEEHLRGSVISGVTSAANSVFLETDKRSSLAIGYLSGHVLLHPEGELLPKRSCLVLRFTDGTRLSVTVSLWGIIRVLTEGDREPFLSRWYGRVIDPLTTQYTWDGFREAIARIDDKKLTAKKFLHKFEPCFYVSGIDSGYAIEVLHRARIHPKRRLHSLNIDEMRSCYQGVNTVMHEAVSKGGRSSEVGLNGATGGFLPHVCKERSGKPCLECGTPIAKLKFEGGTSYFCPQCQPE